MFEDDSYSSKLKMMLASLLILLVMVVVTISSAFSTFGSSVHIVNYGSDGTNGLLTEKEIQSVKEAILGELQSLNQDGGDIAIRWSSFSKPTETRKKFLVDIDSVKQTYQITLTPGLVWVDCPKPTQTLYPDSFCQTDYGELNDSIETTFGDILPYDGKTKDGTKFRLYREETGGLYIHIYDCEYSVKNIDEIQSIIDGLAKNKGANPKIFKYHYLYNYCPKK